MINFSKTHINRKRGQAILIVVIMCTTVFLTIVLGVIDPIVNELRLSNDLLVSKSSFYTAESGSEDVVFRIKNSQISNYSVPLYLSLNGGVATTTITNTPTGKQIATTAGVNNNIRSNQASVTLGAGISFHYGIQAGNGGFSLSQSSSVTGNIFSSGSVVGSGNVITGDVVSAGSSGFIQGVHINGSAYAHVLGATGAGTTVDKNAYYSTLINTSVGGTKFPGSADLATTTLPISDDQVSAWESDAAAGGTLASNFCNSYNSSSNTCNITSNKTLGPKKIPFNLVVSGSGTVLTVTGPLWVTGNITISTNAAVNMDPSLGGTNVAIIADNPSNRASSGLVSVGQGSTFAGSGAPNSFVFMISQNNSAENGGSVVAVSLGQGASALVVYACHGRIDLSQSVSVKEVTAYDINLSQSANVTYDTGLPSIIFESGPSGGWNISGWKEVQ
ncbi:TPA: hypothetical protein DCQ44_00495 [Candidatus Taylorbacteria bacterium]|nr:hypothetical protein [Candidatus Taylorbacteria bacterium]